MDKHRIRTFILRHVLHSDSRKLVPKDFGEELHRQSRKYLFFCLLIASLSWLPYLEADRQLHPDIPVLFYLRIGLTLVSGIALVLQFLDYFVRHARTLLFAVGLYLFIVTGLITGLTAVDPVYVGGYVFILMIIIMIPLFRYEAYILLFSSLLVFGFSAWQSGADISDPRLQYSLRDIFSTTLVVVSFTYILDRLRHKTYLNSMELIRDRSILQEKNRAMEQEMLMARAIQEKFIPAVSPSSRIAHLYKPMEMVGGDYFDYILFRSQDRMGIFLSDVSGHGVPAAFITSMLKSFLLQAGELRHDPARILYYLNDILLDNSGGNFITALYGIVDFNKREFLFANAGHMYPLLIQDDVIKELNPGPSGIPLAVLSNGEMQSQNRVFQNQKAVLHPGDRILLYTDGLCDAQDKKDDSRDYNQRLRSILAEMRNVPGHQLVNEIYWDLVSYHGSEDFQDDICMICVDMDQP